jgi:hypothetical protein
MTEINIADHNETNTVSILCIYFMHFMHKTYKVRNANEKKQLQYITGHSNVKGTVSDSLSVDTPFGLRVRLHKPHVKGNLISFH